MNPPLFGKVEAKGLPVSKLILLSTLEHFYPDA